MGRRAEGPRYRREGATWYVRFTAHGKRHEYSTGETDRGLAERFGARRYAEVLARGPDTPGRRASALSLEDALGEWLAALEATHDEETLKIYRWMAKTKFLPFFRRLDGITPGTLSDYMTTRLREVTRETTAKELSIISGFLTWLVDARIWTERPANPRVPQRATGVRVGRQREAPVDLSLEDVAKLLAALPERSSRDGFLVRDYYLVAYETSLRPTTLDSLEVPRHWRLGEASLRITDRIDKARFGREVDITPAAVAALTRAMGDRTEGLVFGRAWRWRYLKDAALHVFGEERGTDVAPYDLRHGRITHLLDAGGSLSGVAYIAGHKRVTTTDRYARPNRRAAAAALRGSFSGDALITVHADAENTPEDEMPALKRVCNEGGPKGQVSRGNACHGVSQDSPSSPYSGGLPRLRDCIRWLDRTLARLQRDWIVASHLDRAVAAALRRDEDGCHGAMRAVLAEVRP